MDWTTAASAEPKGRTGHAETKSADAATPAPATTPPAAPAVPQIGPPMNAAQAQQLLKYLAADYGLPELDIRVEYSDLLVTPQPAARVEILNASALGMNGEMLAKSFFSALHANYGQFTSYDSRSMRCDTSQVLSNIIGLSLVNTPLNSREKISDYLREHKLLAPRSTQLELDLPEPVHTPAVEAPQETQAAVQDAPTPVIEAKGAEHDAPPQAKIYI